MNNLIEKYSDILNYLNDLKNKSSDNQLKEFAEKSLTELIIGLYNIDKNNKESYANLFEKYNLNKDKINSITENKDNKDKLENHNENKNILDKYKNELANIFKNPNIESIKVWLKNIISYAKENKIEKDKINKFIKDSFNEFDRDKKFTYIVDKHIFDADNTKSIEKINEDIFDINNPKSIKNVTKENNNLFNKDTTEKSELKKDNNIDNDKPLKILNMKKSFNYKIKNRGLALTALAGLGVTLINPLFSIVLGIGGYYLYRKGVKNAKTMIEKNGYSIDDNDNLVDKTGKIITNEEIGKIKYSLIREQLNKIKDGKINKDYKKNRLTSLLLNNKLVNSIKDKVNTIKNDNYESPQLVKDINKGMRNV